MTASVATLKARLARLEQRRGSALATVFVPFGLPPAERAAIVAAFMPPAGTKFLLEVHGTAPSGGAWEVFCAAEAAEAERLRAIAAEAATPDVPPPSTVH